MKRIIIVLASVSISCVLNAQGLNPEVQVTNEYQTRLDDVSKQGPEMSVPDSLLRFDYHFDYSVFDSPYKGSYEFSPYSVTITPDAKPYDGRKLYLSAGAGYVLRPELDIVWAAVDEKRFALNVFANADGFMGSYRRVTPNVFHLNKEVMDKGWDFNSAVGLDSHFKIGRVGFHAEAGYDGVYTGHELYHRSNTHAPYASLRFGYSSSAPLSVSGGAKYRYVHDWHNGSDTYTDHEVLADVSLTARPSGDYRIVADILGCYNNYYFALGLRPHAIFRLGAFDLDAGFRLGWAAGRFTASPAITATVHLLNDYLQIYGGAVGQDHYTMYWDYKSKAHHYYGYMVDPRPVREIADLYLGLDGHADFGLQYDIKAGYRFLGDAPFWAIAADGLETLVFQDCGLFHADLALSWSSESFNLDGGVHFVKIPKGLETNVFEPSMVTGSLKAGYNWRKRIFADLMVDMATDRPASNGATTVIIPGYVNLGAKVAYRMSRYLSFWLKGSNLLNHDIRISPLYSEAGPAVIGGLTFSL